jgi:hypothetical protein
MDLAMVKQEQGETLRQYMRRFFDKTDSTTVVPSKTSVTAAQVLSPSSRT